MTHASRVVPTGSAFDALAFEISYAPPERQDDAFLVALAMQDIPQPSRATTEADMNKPQLGNARRVSGNINFLLWNRRAYGIGSSSADSSSAVRDKRSPMRRGPPLAPRTTLVKTPANQASADRILDLARSAGIYSGHPEPSRLSDAQRGTIERELALKMTAHIDWAEALGPDPQDPTAVYYDGFTLRNASRLTIDQAVAAIEKRIYDRLGTRPGNAFDYLVRPLRDTLIGDPTISLRTPPDYILYGSTRWTCLWDGIQQAKRLNMDPVTMSASDLIMLSPIRSGRKAVDAPQGVGQDKQKGSPAGTAGNSRPGVDALRFDGMMRMANAAGALKLPKTGERDNERIVEQVFAYAQRMVNYEISNKDSRKSGAIRPFIVQHWTINPLREP